MAHEDTGARRRAGTWAAAAGAAGAAAFVGGLVLMGELAKAYLLPGLAVGAPLGAVGGFAYGTWSWDQRRREAKAWQDAAHASGWTHCAEDAATAARLAAFHPFLRARGLEVPHSLAGVHQGVAFVAASVRFQRASGKDDRMVPAQATLLAMPFACDLRIEAETAAHRARDLLGEGDIDFESEAFSRTFSVRGADRRRVHEVLHPAMMDHLLRHGPGWSYDWAGPTLAVTRAGALEPGQALALVEHALAFRGLLPRHLLAQLDGPDAAAPAVAGTPRLGPPTP